MPRVLKLLPLQGALLIALYPGRCPGLRASAPSGRAACVPCPGSIWDMKKFYERFYHSDIKVLRSVAVSYHVQLLRQLVAVFLHNRHLLLRVCCLYCLLPFYQSILSSQRRSVTSTSSGAESSVKAFSFILQMIIIFSENLSFFCCFFSFFRSRVCRIRFHDSVVIFLFRMFAASFFHIPPRSGPLAIGYTIPAIRAC